MLELCLSLLYKVMRTGYRSDFDKLPLEGLSLGELEELACAVKARCLDGPPSWLAEKMVRQRREGKRVSKEETRRADKLHKTQTKLLRYAGPDTARTAEGLEGIKIDVGSRGGGPPNLGILGYVLELVERGSGQVDFYEVADKIVTVFSDRYPSDEYKYRPETLTSLGRLLVRRAFKQQEKIRSDEKKISKAKQKKKAKEQYIKGNARLITPKTKPLYEALKRRGAAGILEQFEEASAE